MTKQEQQSQVITIAEMFNLDSDESIQLPESFLKALQPSKGSNAVIILTPHTKIIRIIPTKTKKVYRLAIDIARLTPDFLQKIGNLFIEMNLKSLYSTGLCFVDDKCVFEGYIDSPDYEKLNINKLKKTILKIDGITEINFTSLEI